MLRALKTSSIGRVCISSAVEAPWMLELSPLAALVLRPFKQVSSTSKKLRAFYLRRSGERVIVCAHHPLVEGSAPPTHLVWNHEEVKLSVRLVPILDKNLGLQQTGLQS